MFDRDVTDEQFQQLVSQLKLWGVPVLVYHRRDNLGHLDTRGQKGFYMGPESGLSMDRVFLGQARRELSNSLGLFSYRLHTHNSMQCACTWATNMPHLSYMTEL